MYKIKLLFGSELEFVCIGKEEMVSMLNFFIGNGYKVSVEYIGEGEGN